MYRLLFKPNPSTSPVETAHYDSLKHAALHLPPAFIRSLFQPDHVSPWSFVDEKGQDVGRINRRKLLSQRKAQGMHDVDTSPTRALTLSHV